MSEKQLFNDFKPVSTEQWEEKILQDLKGADYEKKLVTKTLDGIRIKPYYREKDLEGLEYLQANPGEFPYVRGTKTETNDFNIRQDFFTDDYAQTNLKIIDAAAKGVTSIGLFICHKEDITQKDFDTLLQNTNPEKIAFNFISGKISLKILQFFIAFCEKNNFDLQKIKGSVGFDSFGYKTITGDHYNPKNLPADFDTLKKMYDLVADKFPHIKIININGSFFSNAGAMSTQELAFSLASANEHLVEAENAGIDIKKLLPKMMFTFGIGSYYFIEIAKLRAFRMLWAKICETWTKDKNSGKTFIHSVTGSFNKTVYDPYVNQLRNTSEAMSAVLGGTDEINVNTFDAPYKKPDAFSERIARNTGIILKEESGFDKFADPAGGSYYIENLTNDIAEKTWQLFLEIEEKGGYNKALQENFIQDIIKETANKRDLYIAQRREILLGTNQYPDFNETLNKDADINIMNWSLAEASDSEVEPIKMYRGAKEFEKLRIQVEKSGKRPTVFLLTYGNITMRKARAGFSTGFFACAGYNIIDNNGFADVNEGVKEALEKNADIVVLCSADDEYVGMVETIGKQLEGKATIVVAGYPKNDIEQLKEKGIEHFIHVKVNVLDALHKFNELLKIK